MPPLMPSGPVVVTVPMGDWRRMALFLIVIPWKHCQAWVIPNVRLKTCRRRKEPSLFISGSPQEERNKPFWNVLSKNALIC